MNDDIKEILDRINNYPEKLYCLNENEKHLLLDYITNLQQELETRQYDINNLTYQLAKEKSRIEKAVDYIQNHQLVFELSSKKVISQWFDMFYKDTLNILNGRSDE